MYVVLKKLESSMFRLIKRKKNKALRFAKIMSVSYFVVMLIYIKCLMRGVHVFQEEIKEKRG